jgi:carbon monoxide dehydrogenase subunit G
MVWIRTKTARETTIRTDRAALRALLLDVVTCGRLMPGVEELTGAGDNLYHYRLAEVSNGVVVFQPDYVAKFDTSDPDAITWEPHGEHNFRSWGTFRILDGPAADEIVLRIETRSEANVDVARVVVVLIEPFAQKETNAVTVGFLDAIRERLESAGVPR